MYIRIMQSRSTRASTRSAIGQSEIRCPTPWFLDINQSDRYIKAIYETPGTGFLVSGALNLPWCRVWGFGSHRPQGFK
jgi:hypothetical protein